MTPATDTTTENPTGSSARVWALVVFLVAAALYAGYLARTDFHRFPPEDTVETLVAAREVAAGNGLTTRVISPPVLTFLTRQGRAQPPWPNATRSPLPVLVMGLLMRITSTPTAVALSSGIFFLLSVPLIFLIGHRLAGRAAGLLGSAAYAISPAGLWYGVTGMTESASIFSLSAIVYLLMGEITWGGCALAGVAAGVGYLGRFTFKIWVPLIVGFIIWRAWRKGPARAVGMAALFVTPLLAAMLWFGASMERATGEFGYFGQEDISIRRDTGLYPGRSSSLALESSSAREFVMTHKAIMVRKYGRIAEVAWPAVVKMGLLGLQLLLVPLVSFGHGGVGENRYLDVFGPLGAALGAAFAVELLRGKHAATRRATLVLIAIVALTSIPTLFDLAVGPYHGDDLSHWDLVGAELAAQVGPDGRGLDLHRGTRRRQRRAHHGLGSDHQR
jgi:4-amino-4-deoxy-L-arabinose transferase-like glycosyltransferase